MEMRGMSGELLGSIGPTPPSSNPQTSTPTAPPSSHSTPLPPPFLSKKRKILNSLHPTTSQPYTDNSPKGSIDAGIVDLIDEINAYPGLVTTSSCAGRVSVFLEGRRSKTSPEKDDLAGDGDGKQHEEPPAKTSKAVPVPGGKGFGGRWLFVSHEPLDESLLRSNNKTWSEVFNLTPLDSPYESNAGNSSSTPGDLPRLTKFAFEPLILHVLCADLPHAAPLLAAAVNAGFRESGVQSLKEGGEGVMVGIRTAGLAVESVVGVGVEDKDGDWCQAVVGDGYLGLLVGVSGERFRANEERRERLRGELRVMMERSQGVGGEEGWEDKDVRARRKRAEGLRRREELGRAEGPVQEEEVDLSVTGF